jgi:hypothetical protein
MDTGMLSWLLSTMELSIIYAWLKRHLEKKRFTLDLTGSMAPRGANGAAGIKGEEGGEGEAGEAEVVEPAGVSRE